MTSKKVRFAIFSGAFAASITIWLMSLQRGHRSLLIENRFLRQQLVDVGKLQKGPAQVGNGIGANASVSVAPFSWSMIASADRKTFISNLRAAGCPPETIRDIISQDLKKSFINRKWALIKTTARTDFWAKDYQPGFHGSSDLLARLRDLDSEFNATYTELLGSVPTEQHFLSYIEPLESEIAGAFGDLEPAKLETIKHYRINLSHELSHRAPRDPRRSEDYAKTQGQIIAELTPQELEDYEVRTSEIARNLRNSLPQESRLGEEEFRNAYRAMRNSTSSSINSEGPPGFANQTVGAHRSMR
jgi:hypothetical protein